MYDLPTYTNGGGVILAALAVTWVLLVLVLLARRSAARRPRRAVGRRIPTRDERMAELEAAARRILDDRE